MHAYECDKLDFWRVSFKPATRVSVGVFKTKGGLRNALFAFEDKHLIHQLIPVYTGDVIIALISLFNLPRLLIWSYCYWIQYSFNWKLNTFNMDKCNVC